MRTLSIVERRAIGGGLSSAFIGAQQSGYGAMPNGEGGGTGGGSLAANVAGVFVSVGNATWQNTGANSLTTVVCTPGTIFGFTLGDSTLGKVVNALTGITITPAPSCKIITVDTQTGIETICPLQGGLCQVVNLNGGAVVSSNESSFADQSGFSSLSIGEGQEIAMGGSDLAGGAIMAGSFGNYGGFGFGGDN